MNLKELLEKRQKLVADMRSILDGAADGVMTAEQEAQYDKIDAEQESVGRSIEKQKKLVATEESNKSLLVPTTRSAGSAIVAPEASDDGEENPLVAKFRMHMFRNKLLNNYAEIGAKELPAQFRNLNAGDLQQGGSLMPPQQFVGGLIQALDNQTFVRKFSTVHQVVNSGSLGTPTIEVDLDDAEWTTETGTGTMDTAMRTGLREWKPAPLAKKIKVTKKFLRSSITPVDQLVRNRFAYKFGVTQEKSALTGHGASRFLGVFTASDMGIGTGRDVSEDNTDTEITPDGLINALFSLKEQYQARASWIFSRTAVKQIRKMKDGNGQYMWLPGMSEVVGATILGRPYGMSEYAPSTFTTGQYVGIVGDFSYYWIVDDIGTLEIQFLDQLYAETNQVGWIGRMESDGMPVLQEAFARVKLA